MLVMHGAVWLQLRAAEPIESRARAAVKIAAWVLIASFAAAGLWLAWGIDGYRILSMPAAGALPDPLAKTVEAAAGAWLANYDSYPWMMAAPALGFVGAFLTCRLSAARRPGWAFVTSALAMAGVILTAGFSMFPFVMPSSTALSSGLTVWDAPSSHLTLTVMFWAAVIFVPIILAYTTWTYRAMWGKVTVEHIRTHSHSAY
jgi:cytochrome d ubiquinol oxidase subunit II